MVTPPGEVLRQARAAVDEGDFRLALSSYELFFDRALIDQSDDNEYYGVRLSYCLDEWARLGELFPPARERLDAKAEEARTAFEATKDPEKFHDFQSIRDHMEQSDVVFAQFVAYHESNSDLANLALRFMWNRLVEANRWDICSAYLSDPESKYQMALDKFDECMQVCLANPELGGEEFADQIKGWYVRDAGNLLAALRSTGQIDAAVRLEATIATDMQSRGYSELVVEVAGRATR